MDRTDRYIDSVQKEVNLGKWPVSGQYPLKIHEGALKRKKHAFFAVQKFIVKNCIVRQYDRVGGGDKYVSVN